MKNTLKKFTLLGTLPFMAFGVDVGGSLGVESGYRWDVLKVTGKDTSDSDASIVEKVDNMKGVSVQLHGRLTLNNFYLRANGGYNKILSTPQFVITDNGVSTPALSLSKEYGYDAGGAFGYTFMFNCEEFSLAPEAGFAYQKIYPDRNVSEAAGSPFVGFQFGWDFSNNWLFTFGFDFHFLGFRCSEVSSNSRGTAATTVKNGSYMGPEAKVAFDYMFADNWSLGVAYRFKYMVTTKEVMGVVTNCDQSWMTNDATLKIGYVF